MRYRPAVIALVYGVTLTLGGLVMGGFSSLPSAAGPDHRVSASASGDSAPLLLCDGCFWGVLSRNSAWGHPVDMHGMFNAGAGGSGGTSQSDTTSEQTTFFQGVLRYLLAGGNGS
jgi:hypothetical protein